MSQSIVTTPAPITKKLGAWLYDTLIAIAIYVLWVLFTTPLFMWLSGSDDLIKDTHWQNSAIGMLNKIIPWLLVIAYFVYNHAKSGQTVGMSAWKLMLVNNNGTKVSWPTALLRCVVSIFGLGILFSLLNNKKLGWHDMATKTRVVLLPEKK